MSENKVLEEIKELQEIELKILLDVDAFCKKNDIPYFLGEGTLLGAIRHKGFIPWDDDIDLLMKRADYERFLKIAPQGLSGKYEVQHSTTVKNYWSPFIKIRLLEKEQKYRQQHIEHLSKNNGALIDIFPMEYVPKMGSFKQTMQSIMVKYLRGMLSLKLKLRKPSSIKQRVINALSGLYSVESLHKKLDKWFKLFGSQEREYIATVASYHKAKCQTVPASVYEEQLMVPFEGHMLPVPKGYDLLLTTIYGDYMTPPSEEKRVIKHHFYSDEA